MDISSAGEIDTKFGYRVFWAGNMLAFTSKITVKAGNIPVNTNFVLAFHEKAIPLHPLPLPHGAGLSRSSPLTPPLSSPDVLVGHKPALLLLAICQHLL